MQNDKQDFIDDEILKNKNNIFVSKELLDILELEKVDNGLTHNTYVYLFFAECVFKTHLIKYSSKKNKYKLVCFENIFFKLKSSAIEKIYVECNNNCYEEVFTENNCYTYKITLSKENSYIIDIEIKKEGEK